MERLLSVADTTTVIGTPIRGAMKPKTILTRLSMTSEGGMTSIRRGRGEQIGRKEKVQIEADTTIVIALMTPLLEAREVQERKTHT